MTITAIVDADLLVYRCGFASERVHRATEMVQGDLCETVQVVAEPVEDAIVSMDYTIRSIGLQTGARAFEYYLQGAGNFRNDIATVRPYKGNRKGARKPTHYASLRNHLVENYGAILVADQEADDMLGIRATELGEGSVICTIDKDLLQVPGRHFNWVKGVETIVDEPAGELSFYTQLLVGDSTDNIPGCPAIGVKRAAGLLAPAQGIKEMWAIVLDAYDRQLSSLAHKVTKNCVYIDGQVCYNTWKGDEVKKPLDEYLLEIGRLLWIRRSANQLWTPPVSD